MPENPRIAVLGAGSMGGALLAGMLRTGAASPDRVIATARTRERADALAKEHGIRALAGAGGNLEAAENSDVVILAVKPSVMPSLLEEIRWGLREGRVLVSLAAAFTIRSIEQIVSRPISIFRAIPNTPVLVGEGATCIAGNPQARPEHYDMVERLFRSVGVVCYLDEDLLHAATALSGAGPAYIFLVIEALTAAGLKAGLPRQVASRLAEQTVLGAAKLVRDTGQHPAILRDQVVTPGGATIAGLHELERGGLRASFTSAVEAAAERSREITHALEERLRPAE